jgi:hypothetical protein
MVTIPAEWRRWAAMLIALLLCAAVVWSSGMSALIWTRHFWHSHYGVRLQQK